MVKRRTILIIFRAALIGGLLSMRLWLLVLQPRLPSLGSFPYPGSHQFWELLLGEDIDPGTDEGWLTRAWMLGPLVVIINSLAWLPFTLPVSYLLHRRRVLTRALGVVLLLAGLSNIIGGCWIYIPDFRYARHVRIPFGEDYVLFFALLPSVTLGAIAVLEGCRILRTPQPQRPQQVGPL